MTIKKVIVIGSNSFSGSHFINLLLEKKNYQVIGISRSPEKSEAFLAYKQRKSHIFRFYQYDLNKHLPEIIQLLDAEKPAYIVNFAAQSEVAPSWKNPLHWYQTNVLSLVNLLDQLKDRSYIQKYVHASTPEVYGTMSGNVTEHTHYSPSTPYAASKAAADLFINMLVKNLQFPAVFTRVANIYGPGQQLHKIIPRSIMYLKLGKKIPLHGGGYSVRAFIHAGDASACVLNIMEKGKAGEMYHISTTEFIQIRELVQKICSSMNFDFSNSVEVVGDRLGKDTAYTLDSTKARTELEWEPKTSLDQGIGTVIDWVTQYWDVLKDEPGEYIHKE